MKKVFTAFLLFMCAYTCSFTQVGIGTTTPDSSAVLDLSSTTKGLLIPRMTVAQRNLIRNPAKGLIIYQTSDEAYFFYNGTSWLPVNQNSGWSLNGNSSVHPTDQFIGTLDWRPLRFRVLNQPSGLIDANNNTTGLGYQALATHWLSQQNTGIGAQALKENIDGARNTAVGFQSLLKNSIGSDNTAIGAGALSENVTGISNTATGKNAMFSNTYGSANTAAGMGTLYRNIGGSNNTAMGLFAMYNNVSGLNNTAVGAASFDASDSGSNNTAIGYRALRNNTLGNYNTFIGAEANPAYSTLQNATAIGAKSRADCNNCLVLGSVTGQNGATSSVKVGIGTSLPTSSFSVKASDTGFISVFENTNTNTGDGIKIKLSKAHPMWNGAWVAAPNYSADNFQNQIDVLRGWIIEKEPFSMRDLATLAPSSLLTGTVISIANKVSEELNGALHLPLRIGPYGTSAQFMWREEVIYGGGSIVPRIAIPGLTIPALPVVPQVTVMPEFPQIPNPFPTYDLSLPNLETTNVNNSLTKENEFIRFVDKDDRMLGAIRAQSINDFGEDYFDGVYFVNVMASLVGIDLVSGFMGGIAEFTNLIDDYNNIGVEYSSGHGDYAEWLPRENSAELITSGDIVGVKGGKITRDLTNAEQVMAVSYRPIMLGNAPTSEEEHIGNKIAFLGQVPVKVMGAVNVGDFIVGKSDVPGYGVAINPAKVTPNDLALSVGRAWETNLSEGPKLINTLIGIQNGDYLNILKRSQDKIETVENDLKQSRATIETMELRLKAIEDKMNLNQKPLRK